jgi:hypothetical protein
MIPTPLKMSADCILLPDSFTLSSFAGDGFCSEVISSQVSMDDFVESFAVSKPD